MGNAGLKKFLVCSLVTAGVVVGVGWFTEAKLVAHGALITMAVAALLPFLILAVIVVLPALIMLAFGLFGAFFLAVAPEVPLEIGVEAAAHSSGIVPWYYRLLIGQKHPYFWGVPCGVVIGAGILAGLIAVLIVPGETKTVQILAETQAAIEQVYESKGSYPKPNENGYLPRAALALSGDSSPTEGVVLDGFGQALSYEIKGRWKLASYRLRSYGYDGRRGGDDFCLSGSTKVGGAVDVAGFLLDILRGKEGSTRATLRGKLRGIQSLRCDG